MNRKFLAMAAHVAFVAVILAGSAVQLGIRASADAPAPTVLLGDHLAGTDSATSASWTPYERNSTIEPSIATDPANTDHLVAAYHEGRDPGGGAADIGYAVSNDGGQTWAHGDVPGLTSVVDPSSPYNHASDPVLAFGPGGVVYLSSLVIAESTDTQGNVSGAALAINVGRWSSGGTFTWSAPVFMHVNNPTEVQEIGFFDDKNWVTVDMGTGTGHHHGRVYVVWDIQEVVLYAYCDPDNPAATTPGCDQLSNWSVDPNQTTTGTIAGFGVAYNAPAIGAYPVVLQSGALELVFNDEGGAVTQPTSSSPNFAEVTTTAPAGAVPWPAPLSFATVETVIAPDTSVSVRLQRAAPFMPSVSEDPVSGRIAVGFGSSASRSGAGGDGLNDPAVVISTDNTGQTFGPVIRVDQGAPSNDWVDRYNTAIGFGPAGDLRVMYRLRQEAPDQAQMSQVIDTYYQVSNDLGATWSTPLKVDTQATDVGYCAFSRGGCFEGDYNELAVAGADTYIVREEAYAAFPGEPYNNTGTTFNNDNGNINQHAWVAIVGPAASTSVPETPFLPALLIVGAGGVAILGARRRSRAAS